MRKILLAVLSALTFIAVSCSSASKVGYSHRPLAAEGCSVNYSVIRQNEELFIIATVTSDRLIFADNPIMKLKNFNGDILDLSGTSLSSQSESIGVVLNNLVVPVTELKVMAQFRIEKYQIPFFEYGVQKVRLSTIPIVHEKTFSTDVIGRWLYNKLREQEMKRIVSNIHISIFVQLIRWNSGFAGRSARFGQLVRYVELLPDKPICE